MTGWFINVILPIGLLVIMYAVGWRIYSRTKRSIKATDKALKVRKYNKISEDLASTGTAHTKDGKALKYWEVYNCEENIWDQYYELQWERACPEKPKLKKLKPKLDV